MFISHNLYYESYNMIHVTHKLFPVNNPEAFPLSFSLTVASLIEIRVLILSCIELNDHITSFN